jgi:hypothetical protein
MDIVVTSDVEKVSKKLEVYYPMHASGKDVT